MNAEILARMPQIEEMCRRHGVVRLELFGSATGPHFNPVTSDFDFIATFADKGPGTHYGFRVLEFEQQLASLFDRPVDLLTDAPLRNPYFAQSVNETRRTIYESERPQEAA